MFAQLLLASSAAANPGSGSGSGYGSGFDNGDFDLSNLLQGLGGAGGSGGGWTMGSEADGINLFDLLQGLGGAGGSGAGLTMGSGGPEIDLSDLLQGLGGAGGSGGGWTMGSGDNTELLMLLLKHKPDLISQVLGDVGDAFGELGNAFGSGMGTGLEVSVTGYLFEDCSGIEVPKDISSLLGAALDGIELTTCEELQHIFREAGALMENFPSSASNYGTCVKTTTTDEDGKEMKISLRMHCKDSTGYDSEVDGPTPPTATPATKLPKDFELDVVFCDARDCSASCEPSPAFNMLGRKLFLEMGAKTCSDVAKLGGELDDNFTSKDDWTWGECLDGTNPLEGEKPAGVIVHCKDSTGFDSSLPALSSDNPSSEETKKGGSNTGLIVGVVCSVLVLLALGGFLYWKCKVQEDGVSTPHETGQDSTNAHTSTDVGTEC